MNNIVDAIVKVSKKSRLKLLEKEQNSDHSLMFLRTDDEKQLFLIMSYCLELSGLEDIVTKNWDLLKRSSTNKLLVETNITFSYHRPPNPRDMLVRAKIPQKREPPD